MWIPTSTLAHTTELLYDGLDLGARHHACRREREVGATFDRDPGARLPRQAEARHRREGGGLA